MQRLRNQGEHMAQVEQHKDEFKARCWDALRTRILNEHVDIMFARRLLVEMADIMIRMSLQISHEEERKTP